MGMTGQGLAALANPVWAALHGGQRHLAQPLGCMMGYAPDVAPFVAVADDGMSVPAGDLAGLSEDVFFVGAIPTVPPGWEMRELGGVTQMVYAGGAIDAPPRAGVTLLDPLDPAMQALTDVAFPGYFRARTGTMGRYFGIVDKGQLVALAGERMDMGEAREVSAVCTRPGYTGRGYAALLVRHVMHAMLEEGVTPMLHVGSGNARAIGIYAALGFVQLRQLRHARLVVPVSHPP